MSVTYICFSYFWNYCIYLNFFLISVLLYSKHQKLNHHFKSMILAYSVNLKNHLIYSVITRNHGLFANQNCMYFFVRHKFFWLSVVKYSQSLSQVSYKLRITMFQTGHPPIKTISSFSFSNRTAFLYYVIQVLQTSGLVKNFYRRLFPFTRSRIFTHRMQVRLWRVFTDVCSVHQK